MTPGVVLRIVMLVRNLVVTMTKHPSLRSLKAAWNPILILPPVTIANFPEGVELLVDKTRRYGPLRAYF